MAEQRELFGFNDTRPRLTLKKVITKERMDEVKRLLDKKDSKGAAERLREMREELEKIERRITYRKE